MDKSPAEILRSEFQFYLDHQAEFVRRYDGRVIVLKDHQVIGDYDTEGKAVIATQKEHPLGTFLVQRVSEGTEAYTRTLPSRVTFP